jgi:hypothetical protein
VLAVERVSCFSNARNCTPDDNPRGISMMGIGFGREGDRQAQSGPDKNPFLNVLNGAPRRGYVVTRRGVYIGFAQSGAPRDFALVKLERNADGNDWAQVPACIGVNENEPACGVMLMDTGVTTMYLTVPEDRLTGLHTANVALTTGTRLTISIPHIGDAAAKYTFAVGDTMNAMRPLNLVLVRRARAPFVNTSVRFLNGYDYLFDADGGYVGFRPRPAE